nr:hypothetical protein [Tanacetum cinerariifolium]
MITLAEFMIIAGAYNRPPMLEKSLYDSWKGRMEHYMENRENGRMILNSVQNDPLIWPIVTDADGTTRRKKYEDFSATEKIQANCDFKATNIILQGLVVPVFNLGDDPIAWLNKEITFLTVVASLRFPSTNNQLRTSSNPINQATIQDDKVTMQQVQGMQGQSYAGNSYKGNATSSRGNVTGGQARVVKCYNFQNPGILGGQAVQKTIPNTVAFQTEDLDAYDSDCNDISNAKAVLVTNLSSYDSNVLLEVPHSDSYHNDMDNQSVHAMQDFEQTPIVDF